MILSPSREVVRAHLRQDHEVAEAHDAHQHLVGDLLHGAARRHRLPKLAELVDRAPGSPRKSPSQASDAQRAPPEVPLSATTSTSSGSLAKSPGGHQP